MQQTAEVLVHCHPEHTLVEDLLNFIARLHGFPHKQQVIANEPTGLTSADWLKFWTYTEDVNPYQSLRAEYIPISSSKRPEASQLLLY